MNELEEMLSGVERLAKEATPGPWSQPIRLSEDITLEHVVDFGISPPKDPFMTVRWQGGVCHSDVSRKQNALNAAYIAHLNPAFALSLVSKVREMAEELRVTRRALELATKDARYTFNIREEEYLSRAKKEEVSDGK